MTTTQLFAVVLVGVLVYMLFVRPSAASAAPVAPVAAVPAPAPPTVAIPAVGKYPPDPVVTNPASERPGTNFIGDNSGEFTMW